MPAPSSAQQQALRIAYCPLREFAGQFSPCSEHQQVWISLASRPKKITVIPGKPNARDFPYESRVCPKHSFPNPGCPELIYSYNGGGRSFISVLLSIAVLGTW